nr:MAG TPA: hypothetical protein [Caudoviricetes sp.]
MSDLYQHLLFFARSSVSDCLLLSTACYSL